MLNHEERIMLMRMVQQIMPIMAPNMVKGAEGYRKVARMALATCLFSSFNIEADPPADSDERILQIINLAEILAE